jgi:hypothetical protein
MALIIRLVLVLATIIESRYHGVFTRAQQTKPPLILSSRLHRTKWHTKFWLVQLDFARRHRKSNSELNSHAATVKCALHEASAEILKTVIFLSMFSKATYPLGAFS